MTRRDGGPRRLARASLLLALTTAGCAPQGGALRAALDVDFADDPASIAVSPELSVELAPGEELEFCPYATGLNLVNAAWLAFLSAGEYAHFARLGPVLDRLGFGHAGEGERWAACARDLYAIRSLAARGAIPSPLDEARTSGWGECASEWVRSLEGAAPTPASVAAAFEHWLVHEPHAGRDLEFFSSGEFEIDEERFAAGTTQVVWARHRRLPLVVIAFRGTELRSSQVVHDAMCDARFAMVPFGDWGRVHGGFAAGLDAVDEHLLRRRLAELEGTEVAIWLTGHSLGAALATLMTARVLELISRGADYRLAGLYTFGSPRVGDRAFAAAFEAQAARHGVQVFRFRHANDLVTRIPVTLGRRVEYEHVGRLVYLERDGALHVEPARTGRGLDRCVSDHDIAVYHERLRTLAREPASAPLVSRALARQGDGGSQTQKGGRRLSRGRRGRRREAGTEARDGDAQDDGQRRRTHKSEDASA